MGDGTKMNDETQLTPTEALKQEVISKAELAKFRAENEKSKSKILALDLAAREGNLILLTDAKISLSTIVSELSGRINSMPRKLSAQVAKKSTAAECNIILQNYAAEMLEEIQGLDFEELAKQKGREADEKTLSAVGSKKRRGVRNRTK